MVSTGIGEHNNARVFYCVPPVLIFGRGNQFIILYEIVSSKTLFVEQH